MRFACERHGKKCAAVEGILEADDGRTLCVGARDLDGIFYGLGAGIQKDGFFCEIAGSKRIQFFSDGSVAYVWSDGEAEMQMFFELRLNGGCDARRTMANIETANSSSEIDITVTVYVFDGCTIGASSKEGRGIRRAAGDGRFATRHECARTRPGNFCANLNRSHFLFLCFWPPATR